MASSLPNLGISVQFSPRTRKNPMTHMIKHPLGSNPIWRCNGRITSMATEGRHSLDNLQRASKPQSQPKQRLAPVAPVGLWDRFPAAKTVQQMIETMERVMEDPFSYSSFPLMEDEIGGRYRRGRTPWEIKEVEDEYKMRFDMPGMTREDVKVWIEEKMLMVKAEKLQENNKEDDEVDWSARSYGRYSSRIALPDNIEIEKIRAEVKDGVLYITMPKATISSKVLDINVQ